MIKYVYMTSEYDPFIRQSRQETHQPSVEERADQLIDYVHRAVNQQEELNEASLNPAIDTESTEIQEDTSDRYAHEEEILRHIGSSALTETNNETEDSDQHAHMPQTWRERHVARRIAKRRFKKEVKQVSKERVDGIFNFRQWDEPDNKDMTRTDTTGFAARRKLTGGPRVEMEKYVIPKKVEWVKSTRAELREKFKNGDLSPDEYEHALRNIHSEEHRLATENPSQKRARKSLERAKKRLNRATNSDL